MTQDTQINDKGGREKISRYEVISQLGEGGMGVVYKAHDPDLNKIVAVKVIQTSMLNDEQTIRFQREARALKDLKHAAIPEVYNFAVSRDGEPYLVMEFVQGESLAQFLHKHKPLESEYVVEIALQICEAMKHAHGRGIIHRDLKPANVILTAVADVDFVVVKVIDFGLARLDDETRDQDMTKTGLIMGSPPYMSPEQIQGEVVDHRSDIYSMGCILYEMLTGEPPFRGKSPLSTLTMHISEPPASLESRGVKDAVLFEGLVGKTLAKSPDRRYADMDEVMEDLYVIADRMWDSHVKPDEPAAEDDSMTGLRTTILKRNKQRKQKKLRVATAVGTIVVLVVVGLALFINTSFFVENFENLIMKAGEPSQDNEESDVTPKWALVKDDAGRLVASTSLGIADADLKQLRKLKGPRGIKMIEGLNIKSTAGFTGEGIKYILKAPLKEVDIYSDTFTDKGLLNLAKIKTIGKLALHNLGRGVTDEGLVALHALPLTKLELVNSDLPPNVVQSVSGCKKIWSLSFHGSSPVDFQQLRFLASMPNLDTLDLAETELTDDTMQNLGSLEHLKKLNISRNDISDARLDVILNFPLTELKITDTKVTDIGLASLSEMKTLNHLVCTNCSGITTVGLERFQKKLPGCQVDY